jgi:hypothetical protein
VIYELWVPTRGGSEASERIFLSLMPFLAQAQGVSIRLHIVANEQINKHIRAGLNRYATVYEWPNEVPSVGRARGLALQHGQRYMVMIDDDAVLVPWTGFMRLTERLVLSGAPWVNPIIRFAQGLVDPLAGHTEVWDQIKETDPRYQEAIAAHGPGWARVFDTGVKSRPTDALGGTCFAINRDKVPGWAIDRLLEWPAHTGDEDLFLGKVLGPGLVYNDVLAYHSGWWGWEWTHASEELMCLEPKDTAAGREPNPLR